MTLLNTIKAASLTARKARKTDEAALLSTLMGEIETLAKAGRGELTDAVVVTVIKKFIKNIDQVIEVVEPNSIGGQNAIKEKQLLEAFLPKQLSEQELQALIDDMGCTNIGDAMKLLKQNYAGTYDGAMASKILKAKFA
jgi:uncharacterized protein